MENRVKSKKLTTSFRLHIPSTQFGNFDPFAESTAVVDLTGLTEEEASELVRKEREKMNKEVIEAVTRQKEEIDQATATLFVLQVEGIDPRSPHISDKVMKKLLDEASKALEKKIAKQ